MNDVSNYLHTIAPATVTAVLKMAADKGKPELSLRLMQLAIYRRGKDKPAGLELIDLNMLSDMIDVAIEANDIDQACQLVDFLRNAPIRRVYE